MQSVTALKPLHISFPSISITLPIAPAVDAMPEGGVITVTLGGKGATALTSAVLFSISAGRARVSLDASSYDRLSTGPAPSQQPDALPLVSSPIPPYFSAAEYGAALTVLLNKLLAASGSSNVRAFLPDLILGYLNSNGSSETLKFETLRLTEEESCLVERSYCGLYGVCGILDHQVTALSAVIDAVAALSCEAVRADVGCFNLMDSGDGFVSKEEIGVAGDLKVLLNGSKLVGKVEIEVVSSMPKVNGVLRKVAKAMHAESRVNLNSAVRKGKSGDGAGEAVGNMVLPLADVVFNVGKSSLGRARMNLDSIGNDSLKNDLGILFESKSVKNEDLSGGFKVVMDSYVAGDYNRFVHEVIGLLGMVWNVVAWELITSAVALEGSELVGENKRDGEANGVQVDKKSEKKKKVVLGKGTGVVLQLFNNMLQRIEGFGSSSTELLEKLVRGTISFVETKDAEFDDFLTKVKDIVDSNESRRLPKIPKGTRDFAKEQMAIREKAFSIITEVFKKHGATALDTPVFELRETLMGKYGEDSKLIYDLADQGGELCSLRYDLTVPFARYMAMNGLMSLKRYQIAKVYRRDNPSKGRYREFYQCDFDIAGQYVRMGPDFEVLKILTELLDNLSIGDYEVKLNHRKLLDGMLEICGVLPEKFRTICSSIDKLDKQPFEQIRKEMIEEKGLTAEMADGIGSFVKERGSPLELLAKLQQKDSKFMENKGSVDALNDLAILFKALEKSKCINKIVFDLSLARGLDYYTGVIYEAVFRGTTQVGSIAAGGRYDNLIGMFGNKQVPAVGVSLGIERVFTIMEQLQKDQNQAVRATETQVLVGFLGDDLPRAVELVSEFWDAGLKADYLVNKRVMKHIDHAKELKVPFMVLVGERELSEGIVKLKDIDTAKEEVVPRNRIVEELKKRLSSS